MWATLTFLHTAGVDISTGWFRVEGTATDPDPPSHDSRDHSGQGSVIMAHSHPDLGAAADVKLRTTCGSSSAVIVVAAARFRYTATLTFLHAADMSTYASSGENRRTL